MTITFIGHGYVGLVTATVFADLGNTVYVIGHTPEKIERLKKGDPIIFEPGLEELLKQIGCISRQTMGMQWVNLMLSLSLSARRLRHQVLLISQLCLLLPRKLA